MFSKRRFAVIWDFASIKNHAAFAGGTLRVVSLAATSSAIRNRRIIAMHISHEELYFRADMFSARRLEAN
jgi:hypothetical protein